jgi:hypothetical protein
MDTLRDTRTSFPEILAESDVSILIQRYATHAKMRIMFEQCYVPNRPLYYHISLFAQVANDKIRILEAKYNLQCVDESFAEEDLIDEDKVCWLLFDFFHLSEVVACRVMSLPTIMVYALINSPLSSYHSNMFTENASAAYCPLGCR